MVTSVPELLGATVELTPRAEIAILARALYREGWDDHDVGHITYRQEDDTLLTLPVERGWDEVQAGDILRMDADGNLLEGIGGITPPILLHLEFHRAQPGTNVTVHQHPRYATIWTAAGRVPPPYDQRVCLGCERRDRLLRRVRRWRGPPRGSARGGSRYRGQAVRPTAQPWSVRRRGLHGAGLHPLRCPRVAVQTGVACGGDRRRERPAFGRPASDSCLHAVRSSADPHGAPVGVGRAERGPTRPRRPGLGAPEQLQSKENARGRNDSGRVHDYQGA